MEDTLYGISAFRYHRTPPQVLALLPPVPHTALDSRRILFKDHLLIKDSIGIPVHLAAESRCGRTGKKLLKHHLVSGELPFGSVWDTLHGLRVASPLLTLYQLAATLSKAQLAMAMYEMCGTFAVFKPSPALEELLQSAQAHGCLPASTWRRIADGGGKPSSLWKRPPLVEIDELRSFAAGMGGRRHSVKFQQAAELVTGVCASPFEVQLSLLLAAPRSEGGEGLRCFENNKQISLSSKAARIADQRNCYADLYFDGAHDSRGLVVECQSRMIHDNARALVSDSDRMAALQQMGFDVLPLTYDQIAYPANFDIVVRMIFKKLVRRYAEKSPRQQKAQHDLRRELFINWETLGE